MKDSIVSAATSSVLCPLCGAPSVFSFRSAPDRFHGRRHNYQLLRCKHCCFVWLPSPPRPNEMPFHYDAHYHEAVSVAAEDSAFRRWKGPRKVIARRKRGGTLLDIGCGSGGFLSTMNSGFWKLYGIEMAATTAQRARSNTGAEIFVGDVSEAAFRPEMFDVITCFHVLEHVYDPRQFLASVTSWLKPNGIFYVMLPNINSLEARLFRSYWFGLELPRHLFHFCPQSLTSLATSVGLRRVYLRTQRTSFIVHSAHYVCSELLRTVGFAQAPNAKVLTQNLAWKGVQKALRLSLSLPFSALASVCGLGACMEAIFTR